MKKKLILLATLVCLLTLSMTFFGCSTDSDDDVIPGKWQGTYTGGDATLTLNADGSAVWAGMGKAIDGTYTGVSIKNGGTISGSGVSEGFSGEWVYICGDGENQGIIVYFEPASPEGNNYAIGIGNWGGYGANDIISEFTSNGVKFTPSPNTSGFPTNIGFSGGK